VDPALATVLPVPDNTPKVKASDLRLTIGGVQAAVSSASLAPGQIGVYVVAATLPLGVPPGNAVPVSISVGGQTSPEVTMAVQ
jgi:uncharacterized protein (TIGR03437 family)